MRDRMERLVILPFPVGCISEACVAVDIPHPTRSKPDTNSPTAAIIRPKGEEDISESLSGESTKNSLRLLEAVPKFNISTGFNRLFKGFKNFNQLFVDKEDQELEEEEMDMEIGCPTNVQHVTHIGWDGIATTATATATATATSSTPSEPIKGWKDLCLLFPLSHWNSYELSTFEPMPQTSPAIHLPYVREAIT